MSHTEDSRKMSSQHTKLVVVVTTQSKQQRLISFKMSSSMHYLRRWLQSPIWDHKFCVLASFTRIVSRISVGGIRLDGGYSTCYGSLPTHSLWLLWLTTCGRHEVRPMAQTHTTTSQSTLYSYSTWWRVTFGSTHSGTTTVRRVWWTRMAIERSSLTLQSLLLRLVLPFFGQSWWCLLSLHWSFFLVFVTIGGHLDLCFLCGSGSYLFLYGPLWCVRVWAVKDHVPENHCVLLGPEKLTACFK